VPVAVGEHAPDFTLKDQFNADLALASLRGKRAVVLIFYPATFTKVCQGELDAVQADLDRLQNDKVQVVAVSVDSSYANRVWAEQQGFHFPILSDFWPHGGVAQSYGVFDAVAGRARRATFVIDLNGVVRWLVVNAIPDARDHGAYADAFAALEG
jgi:mycoredoxin-dependent peroxiredoxin